MDDGPKDWCKSCGDPIALYDVFDDPICDCDCAPAQEEKEMESNEMRCRQCDTVYRGDECLACALRERWDRAFFAALGGLAGIDGLADVETVHHAQQCANETIRRHADMMAARDAVIAEVVG